MLNIKLPPLLEACAFSGVSPLQTFIPYAISALTTCASYLYITRVENCPAAASLTPNCLRKRSTKFEAFPGGHTIHFHALPWD